MNFYCFLLFITHTIKYNIQQKQWRVKEPKRLLWAQDFFFESFLNFFEASTLVNLLISLSFLVFCLLTDQYCEQLRVTSKCELETSKVRQFPSLKSARSTQYQLQVRRKFLSRNCKAPVWMLSVHIAVCIYHFRLKP